MASIWGKNMVGYLSLDIICSSQLTFFLELCSRKTVRFSEQIMSADRISEHIFAPHGDYCLNYGTRLEKIDTDYKNVVLQKKNFKIFSWRSSFKRTSLCAKKAEQSEIKKINERLTKHKKPDHGAMKLCTLAPPPPSVSYPHQSDLLPKESK